MPLTNEPPLQPKELALSYVKGDKHLAPTGQASPLPVDKQNEMSLLLSQLDPKPKQGKGCRSLESGHPRASPAYYRWLPLSVHTFSAQYRAGMDGGIEHFLPLGSTLQLGP